MDIELRDLSPAFVAAMQARGASVMPPKRTTYRIQMAGLVEDTARAAMDAALASGAQIRGLSQAERSLEDAFMDAIGSGGPTPPPIPIGGTV